MRWSAQWRTSLAVWLGPLAVVTLLWQPQAMLTSLDGYRLAMAAHAAAAVTFVAPLCALATTWEGSRLRRARWHRGPHARSTLTIAAAALIPALVVNLGLLLASMTAATAPGVPDLRLTATTAIIVTAWGLAGYALGISLPPVLALPAAPLACYAWMAQPHALEPLWLRHLNGSFPYCCGIGTDLSNRAVLGSLLAALGLAAASSLTLRLGPRTRTSLRIGASLTPLLIGFLTGALLVRDLRIDPTTPRTSAVICGETSVRVCVWPEHRGKLRAVLQVAATATRRWEAAGAHPPTRYSERPSDVPTGSVLINIDNGSTHADLVSAMAMAVLPPFPPCAEHEPFLGGDAFEYLYDWLELTAGMSVEDVTLRSDPDSVAIASAVTRRPATQQLHWRLANLNALSRCDIPAVKQVPA